ncbi:MAG TPA: hypothetical protein VGI39_46490 [Polyangiaceae bacterium]
MLDPRTCFDCGIAAPETGRETLTNYHGWRARRDDARARIEWRCPACWQKYKARAEPKA